MAVGPQEWHSAADLYDEETRATAFAPSHQSNVVPENSAVTPQVRTIDPPSEAKSAPVLAILSAYGSEPEIPAQFRWWHGLISGFLLLVFVGFVGIVAWYWWSDRGSVTQTTANATAPSENLSIAPSYEVTPTITPEQPTMARTADEEIEELRERRVVASLSERVEIISALEQAEKKYPNDYRFPYELSKLTIKGFISHNEAFEPLVRAAEKAIDNSRAEEMLNSLMADKDGDFHKLSRGHHEWEALEKALRNKDKGVLKVSAH